MEVDRARLVVPMFNQTNGPDYAGEPGGDPPQNGIPHPEAPCSIVVPGVPSSNQVFQLSWSGLQNMTSSRVAGGTRIPLEPDDYGLVVITEDPQVIQALRTQSAQDGPNMLRLERDLAARRVNTISEVGRQLAKTGHTAADADRDAAHAATLVRQADSLLSTRQHEAARRALASARSLAIRAAGAQRAAARNPSGIGGSPLAANSDLLAGQVDLQRRLATLFPGENRLYGGDFESIQGMLEFGWQHAVSPLAGVAARAELVAEAPRHGHYCLQLTAAPIDSFGAPSIAAEPPLWIVSPPVPLEAGEWVEIAGWARLPAAAGENSTRLQIIDSLGGAELALDLDSGPDWQPFQIVRGVPESTALHLTFVLTGYGTAQVDAVMIRPLATPDARRPPPPTVGVRGTTGTR
jgi:hypothetical protein